MKRVIDFSDIAHIYDEYLNTLYSYALNLGFDEPTVMDAIHDVFYKLCINKKYHKDITNYKSYLLRSLRNRLIDIRRTGKVQTLPATVEDNEPETIPFLMNITVEDELIEKEKLGEIKNQVENFLSRLTDRQREIIYLRYIEEHSYEEIAEIMNISIESGRNLLSKSLNKLKKSTLSQILLFINSIP